MPVGRGDSFARIKRPRWQPVGLNDRHLRSNGKIGVCEQSRVLQFMKYLKCVGLSIIIQIKAWRRVTLVKINLRFFT